MTQTLLIDSGALLAMIGAGDKHYTPAAAFARSHATAIFYLPETVFIETSDARAGVKIPVITIL